MLPNEFKDLVKEALEEHRSDFYVDEETHYNDHKFLSTIIDTGNKVKSTTITTAYRALLIAVLGALWYGLKHLVTS